MDQSETGPAEDTLGHVGAQSRNQARWASTLAVKRTVCAFLGIEAASFFLAATVHAGLLIHGYAHREAMIAESLIGTVLLVGLAVTWVPSRSMYSIAAGVQAFALLGTFVGIWTIVIGIGPRTIPDIVYHAVIVLVLTIGLVLTWRSRKTGES